MLKRYENHERVYFSVADRQLEHFLDKHAFERSLLLNALFQPAILIPDVFFFISRGIERHVLESRGESFLEACVRDGIAVPAFREPDCSSFNEALYTIQGKGDPMRAVQGLRDPESNQRLADRLHFAARNSNNFMPTYWPKHDVGEKFDQLVERYLTCQEPPSVNIGFGVDQDYLNRLWKLTEKWRTDCVYEARKMTCEIAGKGLRRGELFNAIGKELGLPPGIRVSDSADLLAIPLNSANKKSALRVLLRWISALYQYNQAVEFKATPNFPSYEITNGVITPTLLPEAPVRFNPSSLPTFRTTVSFPPMKLLLTISPRELLRVRNEKGNAYFAALMAWQREQNNSTTQELHRALKQYSDDLVKWSKKEQDFTSALLDVTIGARTAANRNLLTSLLTLGEKIVSIKQPWSAPFVALGKVGYAFYLWHAQQPEEALIEFTAPSPNVKILPEVNFPAGK